MTPHRYTELFFLDEAAALSAGHRPCAECRRADYRRFQSFWRVCHGGTAGADEMDLRLHSERIAERLKRTYRTGFASLPDGAYVVLDDAPWLVLGETIHRWSDAGYAERRKRPLRGDVEVLTPRSVTAVLAAGYVPALHPSATEGRR